MRIAILVTAAVALLAGSADAGRFSFAGKVTHVVDGDTVDVRLDSGKQQRVRLIGIDTPERGECGYARATSAARRLAQGQRVVLQGDATQDTRDRYGRLLAYVWIANRDLGLEQLRAGNARVYVYDRAFQRLAVYRKAARPAAGCAAPAVPAVPVAGRCDASYPDVCIPRSPPDLDCGDIPQRGFRVIGADPHRFDGNGDGRGCE
jgi:endonuclease YncB( thermonuclease family)